MYRSRLLIPQVEQLQRHHVSQLPNMLCQHRQQVEQHLLHHHHVSLQVLRYDYRYFKAPDTTKRIFFCTRT